MLLDLPHLAVATHPALQVEGIFCRATGAQHHRAVVIAPHLSAHGRTAAFHHVAPSFLQEWSVRQKSTSFSRLLAPQPNGRTSDKTWTYPLLSEWRTRTSSQYRYIPSCVSFGFPHYTTLFQKSTPLFPRSHTSYSFISAFPK